MRVAFRLAAPDRTDVTVRILGKSGEVRATQLFGLQPGREHEWRWDGLASTGKAAPDGRYRVMVGAVGGPSSLAGHLTLRGHRYPLRARHSFRGAIGRYGAPRSGGRQHRGFDVNAACGKPLFAVRGGTVIRRRHHPRLDGNFIMVKAFKESRTYRYSHLKAPSPLRRGDRVRTGQFIGRVGRTGNARTTPCHLHFELRRGKRWIDPEPLLRRWDRYS